MDQEEVFKFASTSLQIVDETDVPTITRTILKTITKGFYTCYHYWDTDWIQETADEVVSVIRNEVSNVSSHTCGLVLEIINNALTVNSVTGL